MSRLMCETKLAYYPTDPDTLQKVIDRFLRFPSLTDLSNSGSSKKTFILDPCCGTGNALNVFREFSNDCVLYGIEIDEQRAKEANAKLDRVLNAEAIWGVRKSSDWAGLLFLNPPYGLNSLGDRLEIEFVDRYANCVTKGGVMVLVINPSSADEKTAKALINSGYKPIASVYDPDNNDYKSFKQFFVVLQRIDRKFRFDLREFQEIAFHPVCLDEAGITQTPECHLIHQAIKAEPIEVPSGIAPSLFKEIELPDWKLKELFLKSRLLTRFNALTATAEGSSVSIEVPNEGQAAVLVASGALGGKTIGGWLLKGQVVKSSKESAEYNPETGETTGIRVRDEYKTIVYGLNVKSLEFARFE